jgi:hypothetical protein
MLANLWAGNSYTKIFASQNFGWEILGTNQAGPYCLHCELHLVI